MRRSRRSLLTALLFMLLAVWLAAASSYAKKAETGFLDRTITVAGTTYKYQVFVPEDWASKKVWPIILFLHGAGERGDDGLVQTQVGIGRAIRVDRRRFPAIVVIPSAARKSGGLNRRWTSWR